MINPEGLEPVSGRDIVFFAAVFIFVYSQVFQLPCTPIYFEGDNLVSVSNAMRMMGGEVIYKDFFHLTPPGAEIFYSALFSVFGVKIWVLNATIVILGMSLAWLLWFFSRRFFSGWLVYLPAAIFFIIGFRAFLIDGSYRLFSVAFVFAAVAAIMAKTSRINLAAAGVLCGLATLFVQPRGVLGVVAISIFLLWENYSMGFDLKDLVKRGFILVAPFIITVVLTQGYFVYQAGFDNYYFSLVTFLQKHYPNDPLAKKSAYFTEIPDIGGFIQDQPVLSGLSRYVRIVFPPLFVYILIPAVYLAFLLFRRLRKPSEDERSVDRKLVLLCICGLVLALGVSAPTAQRFFHVAIPAVIIFVWLLTKIPRSRNFMTAAVIVLMVAGFAYIGQRQWVNKNFLDMPAGRAAFLTESGFQRYRRIGEETRPGDVFYEAIHPSFYFPFHLRNPTPLYLVRDSDYTPAFQVDAVIDALEKQPPNIIIWPGRWSKPAGSRAEGDNLAPLWQFVSTNYHLSESFIEAADIPGREVDMQIWKRNKELLSKQ